MKMHNIKRYQSNNLKKIKKFDKSKKNKMN